MQNTVLCLRQGTPQMPSTEEIQPCSKTGFGDHKCVLVARCPPSLREHVLFKKYVAGFCQTTFSRIINVTVVCGLWVMLAIPF